MKRILLKLLKNFGFLIAGGIVLFMAGVIVWVSLIQIPDFKSFEDRKVVKSTKIYDRTGEVVLYDVSENIKRTVIPLSEMGVNIKNATVAIEDTEFYQHKGIRLKSIARAFWANVVRGGFSQGGSTITQQLLKNTLLSREKTLTRKLKEWILSIKIESFLSKDEILEAYLNEAPYGGVVYGIEEAAQTFFGKNPANLTLAEAAYLAALPKAPTHYSPYGKNKAELDQRKNVILKRMAELNFITEEEHLAAKEEEVLFKAEQKIKIRAPHFVFFVKNYLEEKYGPGVMEAGLKVVTTLDYELQQKAEEATFKIAQENEKNFEGRNAGLVAVDPNTGQILTMVGSRDYFDQDVDGAYNVALALRQPGSAFKPFTYAQSFNEGYHPNTVLFDVKTEFQTTCDPDGRALPGYKQEDCYSPSNYDNRFRGPMTVRDALAQSINVPAVKMLYLVGVPDAIRLARDMGINTLEDPDRYGLTLVIGGGEVTLMDITSAYGAFASGGVRYDPRWILKIEDSGGKTTEEFKNSTGRRVLPENTALMISDILSDNEARIGTFGAHSVLEIPGAQVAVKTGTTNNNRDAWTIGYTPSIVVGVWVGNNDNTPMKKGGAALAGPIWNTFVKEALKKYPAEPFKKPDLSTDHSWPPVLRGYWQGGESFFIDKISGKLATERTPKETREERFVTNVHDILYWVEKNNPRILRDPNSASDRQLEHWDTPVLAWWEQNKYRFTPFVTESDKPTLSDDVHTPEKSPKINVSGIDLEKVYSLEELIGFSVNVSGVYNLKKVDVFLNDTLLKSFNSPIFNFSFIPQEVDSLNEENEIKIIAQDMVYNTSQKVLDLKISAGL